MLPKIVNVAIDIAITAPQETNLHYPRALRSNEEGGGCVREVDIDVGVTVCEGPERVSEGEERAAAGADVERWVICRGQRVGGQLELGVDAVVPASGREIGPGGIIGRRHPARVLGADLAAV